MQTIESEVINQRLREVARAVSPAPWPADVGGALRQAALQLSSNQQVPFFLPILYIEPTNACNCNCVMCPRRNMTRPIGFMDMDLFDRIVSMAASLGPSEVRLFHYGEPLLHPRLPDMVARCRSLGLPARFQTNGLLARPETIRALLEAGLDYLGVSVNGLTPREYAQVRPGHDVQTVSSNLRAFRSMAAEMGVPLHIHINAQILRDEIQERQDDLDTFKRTWLALADTLSISGLSLYDRIAILRRGSLVETDLAALPRKPDDQVRCLEPFNRLVVKWDGRATVCCADYDARMVVGDLATETLEAVWSSAAISDIRTRIRQHAYRDLPACRTCPLFFSAPFNVVYKRA